MYRLILATVFCFIYTGVYAQSADKAAPKVELETDLGVMVLELYPEKAPLTVANFQNLVEQGFYNGLIFHRVIPNFMAQTGGYTFDFQLKSPQNTVVNESANGLKNHQATIAMARTMDPDSASSQFFINLVDNPHLDAQPNKPGYTVFGKVIKGFDTVQKIAGEARGQFRAFPDAPNVPVRIIKASMITEQTTAKTPANTPEKTTE